MCVYSSPTIFPSTAHSAHRAGGGVPAAHGREVGTLCGRQSLHSKGGRDFVPGRRRRGNKEENTGKLDDVWWFPRFC